MSEPLSPLGEFLLKLWCRVFHRDQWGFLRVSDPDKKEAELWCQKCRRLRYSQSND